jgi:hypothetical protein
MSFLRTARRARSITWITLIGLLLLAVAGKIEVRTCLGTCSEARATEQASCCSAGDEAPIHEASCCGCCDDEGPGDGSGGGDSGGRGGGCCSTRRQQPRPARALRSGPTASSAARHGWMPDWCSAPPKCC